MAFAKWVFRIAGIYGIGILGLCYFSENALWLVPLPALNHPEFFYGFVGVGMAFQLVFLIISTDPAKYRALMIPSMVEKFSYIGALLVLYSHQRISAQSLQAGFVDGTLGLLFVAAYFKTTKD